MKALGRVPVHPFLFAIYPILFLYSVNLDEVLPVDVVQPAIWAAGVTGGLVAVLALVLRSLARAALVTSALVVAWFFFGHAAPGLDSAGLSQELQLAAWGLLVGLSLVVALRAGPRLGRVTEAANVLALALVALTLVAIVPYEAARATRVARAAPPTDDVSLPAATRNPGRDIFYLVFDRYGSDWSLKQRFGIENDLTGWLAERGFQVVPGARANYRATDFSLASTLQMDYLDELTERHGTDTGDRTPARALLQDHTVGRFLKENGYRYVHISASYNATLNNALADEVLRYDTASEFGQVMSDMSMAPLVEDLVSSEPESTEPPNRERHRDFAEYQLRQVQRAAAWPSPVFVFAHILLPHSPYVFHADGSDLTLAEERELPEAVSFAEQLRYTNTRIRETVDVLLNRPPGDQPIIVIQADEGPFICGNVDCLDGRPESYGIRFGILGAYYLPDLGQEVLPPDHSSVNTFRTILREYFGADFPPLPNRSFTWPDNDHLYDFHEITDALPLPGTSP